MEILTTNRNIFLRSQELKIYKYFLRNFNTVDALVKICTGSSDVVVLCLVAVETYALTVIIL